MSELTRTNETAAAEQTAAPADAAPGPDAMMPPTREGLLAGVNAAWDHRADPGRFDTGGKQAVFYSAEATVSAVRSEGLGKAPGERIHSGELAEKDVADNPDSIRVQQTPGGQELTRLQNGIDSGPFTPEERKELKTALFPLWEDASAKFADSAAAGRCSRSYSENTTPDTVLSRLELPRLRENPNHVHMSDAPLAADGTPPEQDQYPDHMLNDGKMHSDVRPDDPPSERRG